MRTSLKFIVLALFAFMVIAVGNGQVIFRTPDSLFNYAKSKSVGLLNANVNILQAKKAKLAAVLSVPDLVVNNNFSYTNNTRLPVNLFPSEILGGTPGTFTEVQTGVQFNTNFTESIDIKLVNLAGWQNLKLARINIEASSTDGKLLLKNLYDNIAAAYYNIVNLKWQVASLEENLMAADTLLAITRQKYKQGLNSQQQVNEAQVNYLSVAESKKQLQYSLQQQFLALKLLCDIPETEPIDIVPAADPLQIATPELAVENTLDLKQKELLEKMAWVTYQQNKYNLLPTISFFQAFTTQQFNQRGKFLDGSVKWIPSSYLGLRLSMPLPKSKDISQLTQSKYNYQVTRNNTSQQKIKSSLQRKQLEVDLDKAISQAKANVEIYELRKETYQKNLNLYREGLLAFDQTLNSFEQMVNSRYNLITASINTTLAKTKIQINNTLL